MRVNCLEIFCHTELVRVRAATPRALVCGRHELCKVLKQSGAGANGSHCAVKLRRNGRKTRRGRCTKRKVMNGVRNVKVLLVRAYESESEREPGSILEREQCTPLYSRIDKCTNKKK